MPLGEKVNCSKCQTDESLMFHRNNKGEVVCNDCYGVPSSSKKSDTEETSEAQPAEKPKASTKKATKTVRSCKTRQHSNSSKQPTLKTRSRRNMLFKKNPPTKAATTTATVITMESCMHKNQFWRVGDIVSVRDTDGEVYYCQLTGFLQDEYCEKSASFVWLLPTINESKFPLPGFDPMHYVLGPPEELPHSMDNFEFVMHAPSDYFKWRSPFPSGRVNPREGGVLWTPLRAVEPPSTITSPPSPETLLHIEAPPPRPS